MGSVEQLINLIDKLEANLSINLNPDMNCMLEFYFVNEDQKPDALIKYLQKAKDEQGKYPKTAVFCTNYVTALKLTFALTSLHISALPTSKSAINQFNNDEVSVLFITDVCEELPDINYKKCDVIVNLDIPTNIDTYLKRMRKVCAKGNAKYITYAVPEIDNKLLFEIAKALGISYRDIFLSLTAFSTRTLSCSLPDANQNANSSTNFYHRQPLIRSFEADITEIDYSSEDDMTDDSNESIVSKAVTIVGDEIQGFLDDIADAASFVAKCVASAVVLTAVMYIFISPFTRCYF